MEQLIKDKLNQLHKNNAAESLENELNSLLLENNVNAHIMTRIKDLDKAIEKMDRKGYEGVEQLSDLLGGKLVTNNLDDIYKIKNIVKKNFKIKEINDYINHPITSSGYQSLHMDVEVNNLSVELQIKTLDMDRAQKITHDTLYKGDIKYKSELTNFINALSNQVYNNYIKNNNDIENYINSLAKNISNENKLLNNQYDIIKAEASRFKKAQFYLDNISIDQKKVDSINNKNGFFNNKHINKYMSNINTYKDNLKTQCNINSIADFKEKYTKFLEVKRYLENTSTNKINVNNEKLQILKNISKSIVKEKIINQYKKEFPQIKYISSSVANTINRINQEYGFLTVKDMKNKYSELGKKLEQHDDLSTSNKFKELQNVISDFKEAQMKERQSAAHEKSQQISKVHDITLN